MSEDTPEYKGAGRTRTLAEANKERIDKVESDHKHLGRAWNEVDDRQNQLEARITKLEEPIHVQLPQQVTDRLNQLEVALGLLMQRANCQHEAFSLDGGRTAFYIMAVADERELAVLVPGQKPEPAFALAICKHCWQTYVAVNKAEEPPAPPPIKLVREGEEVVG